MICVISFFYKAFVQFSSRSAIELILKQFLNYSENRKRNPSLLKFFTEAFNIKLVNSFILVWHSDYEFSNKTQKPFFILKESNKCYNVNYVVMFCFCFQSIERFINKDACYFNTHRLEGEGEFSWNLLLNLCRKKNKNVIHRPRSVRIGRNCALGLSTGLGHSFSQYGPSSRWIYSCSKSGLI